MPIMARKSEFTPCPEGPVVAVTVDVVDEGMRETFNGKMKPKIRLIWQVNKRMDNGQLFSVHQWFTNTMHPKGALRPIVQALLGRRISDAEVNAGFDLEAELIGTTCILHVVHEQGKDGRIFANVESVTPLMPGIEPLKPENYVRVVNRPKDDGAGYQRGTTQEAETRRTEDDDIPF